jgi:hypothetical protein
MSTDNKLLPVLRAVHQLQVQQAPEQHRLRTADCPSLSRFAVALQEGWTPEEREHMDECPYCKQLVSIEDSLAKGDDDTRQTQPAA